MLTVNKDEYNNYINRENTCLSFQVAEGRNVYIEMAGNIAPVTKSGDQLRICFHVFHESRLPFTVRVRDSGQPAGARMAFISEPRPARNGILGTPSPLPPVCTLSVALPDDLHVDSTTDLQTSLEQPTLASSSAHCLNGSCRRQFKPFPTDSINQSINQSINPINQLIDWLID